MNIAKTQCFSRQFPVDFGEELSIGGVPRDAGLCR
jgi:hypothetical protein